MKEFLAVTIAVNVSLLAVFLWLLSEKGMPKSDEAWLLFLALASPAITLGYFFASKFGPENKANTDPSLIGLEIEVRKARLQNELKALRNEEPK